MNIETLRRIALLIALLMLTAGCPTASKGSSSDDGGNAATADGSTGGTTDEGPTAVDISSEETTGGTTGGSTTGGTTGGGTTGGATGGGTTGGATTTGPPPSDCTGCETGEIKGVVCSPNAQVFVNGAKVVVDTVDCNGQAVHLETVSDAQGFYTLTGVPCGTQQVQIDKASYHHEYDVVVPPGGVADVTAVGKKQCFKATSTKIAVITGDWDELEGVLDGLGFAYDLHELYAWGEWNDGDWYGSEAHDLLTDPAKLATYQVIFINCGGVHHDIATDSPAPVANLKQYVENGGSLYVSDWAWIYPELAWPAAIDFHGTDEDYNSPKAMTGNQIVPGTIVDPALKSYLGKGVMSVYYDIGPLIAVDAPGPDTVEHVIGFVADFQAVNPLILSFRPTPTSGKVIYSNFHNDAQANLDMQAILNYLVFTL